MNSSMHSGPCSGALRFLRRWPVFAREKIKESVEIMKKARFCMIFFGMGCTHTDGRNHNIDAAISLTRDLNTHTKCSIMAMRGHYNIAGPGQVWAWQFGFPVLH